MPPHNDGFKLRAVVGRDRPHANVHLVGDLLLGIGTITVVGAAIGARLPSPLRSLRAAPAD